MESINEFIKNFRERLSSPFFFSFIVSWLFINWKITVALLWYNPDHYPNRGDLINFIQNNTSNWHSIWLPLFGAIVYTGLLRNAASAIVTFSGKWGGKLNLFLSKGSKVPISKFLAYRELFDQTNKDLEKVLADETNTRQAYDTQRQKNHTLDTENTSLKNDLLKLKTDNDQLQLKLQHVTNEATHYKGQYEKLNTNIQHTENLTNQYKDKSRLNGTWKFRYDNNRKDIHYDEIIHIQNGIVYRVTDNRTESIFNIMFFFVDPNKKKIFLVLKFIPDSGDLGFIRKINSKVEIYGPRNDLESITHTRSEYEPFLIHDLDIKNEKILAGTENVEALITYTRLTS